MKNEGGGKLAHRAKLVSGTKKCEFDSTWGVPVQMEFPFCAPKPPLRPLTVTVRGWRVSPHSRNSSATKTPMIGFDRKPTMPLEARRPPKPCFR